MQSVEYTIAYKNDVSALLSHCFSMTAAESAVMLDDALVNGGCRLCVSGGKAVSVALFKTITLLFGGARREGVYIFGLCTAENYRGAGMASNLVKCICDISDADFAVLIPENPDLFSFYEKLGFVPNGYGALFSVAAASVEPVRIADSVDEAYAAYKLAAEMRGDICLLSESDFSASLAVSPQVCVVGESGICLVSDSVEVFAPADRVAGLAASALSLCCIRQAKAVTPLTFAPAGAVSERIGMIKALREAAPPERFYINNLFNR